MIPELEPCYSPSPIRRNPPTASAASMTERKIRFEDPHGREFSFPLAQAKTWKVYTPRLNQKSQILTSTRVWKHLCERPVLGWATLAIKQTARTSSPTSGKRWHRQGQKSQFEDLSLLHNLTCMFLHPTSSSCCPRSRQVRKKRSFKISRLWVSGSQEEERSLRPTLNSWRWIRSLHGCVYMMGWLFDAKTLGLYLCICLGGPFDFKRCSNAWSFGEPVSSSKELLYHIQPVRSVLISLSTLAVPWTRNRRSVLKWSRDFFVTSNLARRDLLNLSINNTKPPSSGTQRPQRPRTIPRKAIPTYF
jgi:hypothetical protein